MPDAFVRIDNAALASVLRGPQGPVARHLIVTAEAVRQEAKRLVGYDTSPDRDASVPHLRDTIVKRFVSGGPFGFTILVGSNAPHALMHHEGTRAHTLPAGKLISFRPRGSIVRIYRWTTGRNFKIPAFRGTHYLTRAISNVRSRL